MDTRDVVGKFINELQIILNTSIPTVERDIIDDIKADADEALTGILDNRIKNEKVIDVIKRYSCELGEIRNKLNQLEKGRIYEFTKAQMDGYLATNIGQLKDMLNDLIDKIEHGKESDEEKLGEIFRNTKI